MNQSRGKSNKNSGGNATSKTDDKKYEYDGHPLGYATFKDKVKAKLRDTDSLNLLKIWNYGESSLTKTMEAIELHAPHVAITPVADDTSWEEYLDSLDVADNDDFTNAAGTTTP